MFTIALFSAIVMAAFAAPPPADEVAKMARYVVHSSDWAPMAYTSEASDSNGYPVIEIFSMSDGVVGNSTGHPYFYVTPLLVAVQQLQKDGRTSIALTLADTEDCKGQDLDPEDPRCPHIIITGKFRKIEDDSDEANVAKEALFSRHPIMATWPANHSFFFCTIDIETITVLDNFGGPKTVTPDEYYKAEI